MATTSKFDFGLINDQIKEQSDQIVALDGYLQVKSLGCASLDNLKSNLLGIANSLPYNRAAFITFWNSGVTDVLTYNGNYAGTLYNNYKTDTELIFTAVVSGKDGSVVSIGYTNGTWAFKNLTNQIATLERITEISNYGLNANITIYNSSITKIFTDNHFVSVYMLLQSNNGVPQFTEMVTGLPKQKNSAFGIIKHGNNMLIFDVEGNGKLVNQVAIPAGNFTLSILYMKE